MWHASFQIRSWWFYITLVYRFSRFDQTNHYKQLLLSKNKQTKKKTQKYFKFLAGLSALDFLDWWGFLALMICFCENVFWFIFSCVCVLMLQFFILLLHFICLLVVFKKSFYTSFCKLHSFLITSLLLFVFSYLFFLVDFWNFSLFSCRDLIDLSKG